MDKETLDIQRSIKLVGEMVRHEGWEIVAKSLQGSIEAIEHLDEVEAIEPQQLFLEIKSRKLAKKIIAGWLHDVMGVAQVAESELAETKESYIITKEL